jgi:hypothetical protein
LSNADMGAAFREDATDEEIAAAQLGKDNVTAPRALALSELEEEASVSVSHSSSARSLYGRKGRAFRTSLGGKPS